MNNINNIDYLEKISYFPETIIFFFLNYKSLTNDSSRNKMYCSNSPLKSAISYGLFNSAQGILEYLSLYKQFNKVKYLLFITIQFQINSTSQMK